MPYSALVKMYTAHTCEGLVNTWPAISLENRWEGFRNDGGKIFILRTVKTPQGAAPLRAHHTQYNYYIRIHKTRGPKCGKQSAATTVSISSVGYVLLSCAHVNHFTFERVPACRHGRPTIAFAHSIILFLFF